MKYFFLVLLVAFPAFVFGDGGFPPIGGVPGYTFTTVGGGTVTITGTGGTTLNTGTGGTLGSNAFTSTGFLPLTGGTLSGPLVAGTASAYQLAMSGSTVKMVTQEFVSGYSLMYALPLATAPSGSNYWLAINSSSVAIQAPDASTALYINNNVFRPQVTTNIIDLGAVASTFKTGYFGTSVVTPTIVLSTGITGVTGTSNAGAGIVGEYTSASVVSGSAQALTTATPKTIASITLTAGDWDITAISGLTGASTGTEFDVAVSATTNSLSGTVLGDTRAQTPTVSLTGADASLMVPSVRVTGTASTTYYLVVQETFTVGTPAAYGRISARRPR